MSEIGIIKTGIIKETVNGFVRQLEMTAPLDRRHPVPAKNYGISGMSLQCLLIKNKRAVHFLASLPVYLPRVADELWGNDDRAYNPFQGMGADVGYHSPLPTYSGQTLTTTKCPYTEGDCYTDGSSLIAMEWYDIFLRRGLDEIWRKLEARWDEVFGQQEDGQ